MSNLKKRLTSLLIMLASPISMAFAENYICLQAPARILPCENLVYRAVKDPETNQNRLFCFCRQDFERILKTDVTDEEFILNKMEWRQIVAESGYTDAQLKSMIKR